MDNQIENQVEVQLNNRKSSKGLIVLVVILVLLVLGLGGYIVCDKFITTKNGNANEPVLTEKEELQTDNSSLTQDLALSLGKEKYEYVREGLYLCGYKQLTLNPEGVLANTIGGDTTSGYDVVYHEILNIDNIKNNLASNVFDKFVSSKLITYQNKYYIVDGCGGDPTYASNKYQMEVKNIQDNYITYTVTEYFYTVDNDGNVVEDLDRAEKYTTIFGLTKENYEWKISEYEDAYTSHINKNNNE